MRDELMARLRELPGVEERPSQFNGCAQSGRSAERFDRSFPTDARAKPARPEARLRKRRRGAFWIDGREFVHFHGDAVEIRLTRRLIRDLDEPRAPARARTSDWVIVDADEHELTLALARRALEANRTGD